ncbi:DUF512 domain-containing protein [bacterium CPR1]|nr:DUF512 domain-containing protein [bacterium CPR1]
MRRQQVPGPVDGSAQGGLAPDAPAPALEQLEAPADALDDLLRRQHAHARGGKLQGQRQPVQHPHQAGYVARVRLQPEGGQHGGRAVHEELHRRVDNLTVRLVGVPNEFFGRIVKCAGLLAGRDILATLEAERAFLSRPGTRVMVPGAALKDAAVFNPGRKEASELFLDDVPMQGLADHFRVPFVVGGSYCPEWLDNLFGRVSWHELRPQEPPMPIEIIDFPVHAARSSCQTP